MSLTAEATTTTVHLRSRSPRKITLAPSTLSVEVEEVPRASLPSVAGRLGDILLAQAANVSVTFDPSDHDAAGMFSQLELGVGPGKTVRFVARAAIVPLRRRRRQGLDGLEDVASGGESGVERQGDERSQKRKEEKRKGEMIGTVKLAFHTTPDGHKADVRHLLVHPEYERRGVARKLMAKLEAEAKASKIKLLLLETDHSPAQAFFECLGFTSGLAPGYASTLGKESRDGAIMYKELRCGKCEECECGTEELQW